MSVYPLFLVLGSDGTIGAYAREDILKIHLAENYRLNEPARAVFKLTPNSLTVSYERVNDYAEWTVPLENLCPRHLREALPLPTKQMCRECNAETDSRRFQALNQGAI